VGKIPYELLKKAMSRSEVDKQRVLRRPLSLLKPIWPLLIIGLALSILLRILSLIPPYLMKMLVDEVVVRALPFGYCGCSGSRARASTSATSPLSVAH